MLHLLANSGRGPAVTVLLMLSGSAIWGPLVERYLQIVSAAVAKPFSEYGALWRPT